MTDKALKRGKVSNPHSFRKASFGDQYLNANEVANVKLLNQYYADRKFPDY